MPVPTNYWRKKRFGSVKGLKLAEPEVSDVLHVLKSSEKYELHAEMRWAKSSYQLLLVIAVERSWLI